MLTEMYDLCTIVYTYNTYNTLEEGMLSVPPRLVVQLYGQLGRGNGLGLLAGHHEKLLWGGKGIIAICKS